MLSSQSSTDGQQGRAGVSMHVRDSCLSQSVFFLSLLTLELFTFAIAVLYFRLKNHFPKAKSLKCDLK